MATKTLGDMSVGSLVKLIENGELVLFYVTKHDYESELNGTGRTLLVRRDGYDKRQWHSTKVNAYADSDIDRWLNSTYKGLFPTDIQTAIGTTKFYYTPGNGNNTVTPLTRSIFLLSAAEFGYGEDSFTTVEGSALPETKFLRTCTVDGTLESQWLRSPNKMNITDAKLLSASGSTMNEYCTYTRAARPVFTLPSTLIVDANNIVSTNTAPTITGSSISGSDLGVMTTGFDFTYQVNDIDGDNVTVKEYLDNTLQRSYPATLGATNTFQCVTASNFQTILNGVHALKIVANDGKMDSAAFTVTFTKLVTTATITLATPLPADDIIAALVINLTGSMPDDVVLTVMVTNNAKDSSPVWEDATVDIKNGNNHVFANKTAVNGFAFNFRVTVSRGDSNVGGYITNIGGAFE